MKVIKEFKVQYVVPETDEERKDIENILRRVEEEKGKPVDISNFKIIDNRKPDDGGSWRVAEED